MHNHSDVVFFLESSKNMGGQEWQLLQQMEALNAQGLTTYLFCNAQGRINNEARSRNLSVINLPFRNSFHLPTIHGIRKSIKKYRPVACICHSGHDANNLSIAAITLAKRPKIIRSRTYYTNRKPNPLNRLLPVDLVMVPSQFMVDIIKPHFPGKEIRVVYPGINFAKLDSELHFPIKEDLSYWLDKNEGDVIIQLGMYRSEKGHSIILSALEDLIKRRPQLKYIMAGGGGAEKLKEEVNQRGLQNNVWMGELKSVAAVLKKADVLVMPSIKEPLGMAQIEALSLAVPVIVSHEGGLPETVHDRVTGLVVARNEPQQWREALDFALSNKETMLSYAQAGQKDVRLRFGLEANTASLLRVIRS
ncbi:glycosyltransferase family 4 protein [Pectobacterium sp. B1J-3]|uniref:glycosyltransferase family 4 protein n=1 Tax=Pectobacterium sp. B1J-3 TaxID=3385371 RepID=UPI003905822F